MNPNAAANRYYAEQEGKRKWRIKDRLKNNVVVGIIYSENEPKNIVRLLNEHGYVEDMA